MFAKNRNGPGNGYRSNAMGMGGAAAAPRIPPEGSMRGQRMYNSEYRNYNRGGYGGRGHSKQFQAPLPPPNEADIFMEAGRMAAEYLVSKGMLPPNALSGNWQSNGFKNQIGNFQGFRYNEAEKVRSSVDSRESAHSRLGNYSLDVDQGRRKYSDEYRSSIRGRKGTGSFKNHGVEVGRELGRSGSLTESIRPSPGAESENGASIGHHDEQPAGKDGSEVHDSSLGETAQEIGSDTQIVIGLEKHNLVEYADGNNSTLSNEKCTTSDANHEVTKKSDDDAEMNSDQNSFNDLHLKNDEKKEFASSGIEDTSVSEDHVDLVKHCKFINVPTKTRSSLTIKGRKGDQNPINEDENICKSDPLENSGVHITSVDNSAGNAAVHQDHELKGLPSDDLSLEVEMNITDSTKPTQSLRSESFPERSVYKELQPDAGFSGLERSNSMHVEKGEKRANEFNSDSKEDFKRLRQCVPPQDSQSNASPPISSPIENKLILQEPRTSQAAYLTPSSDHNNLDVSIFSKDRADTCEFMQEKQLFPSSFKTCDLNLVGACDVNENHDADPILVCPSVTHTVKTSLSIDVDLSMGNIGNTPDKFSKHSVNEKGIEVIDLENDFVHEDKTFCDLDRRGDAVFTDLDGFPNNSSDMPDVQDGYGLMISELLGNASPNHMGLQNAEGIIADDDSIYMSLEEIPISILGSWEQPSQDYGKPF